MGMRVLKINILKLGCVLWLSQAAFGQSVPGLAAAYALNEGTGTSVSDVSGSANAGTTSSTTWTTGKYGQALSFNGSTSFVTIADSASLDLVQGTVEFWFRRAGTGGWRSLLAKGSVNDDKAHNYFVEFQPNNRLFYGVGNGATYNSFSPTTTFTDTTNFHHLAMDLGWGERAALL